VKLYGPNLPAAYNIGAQSVAPCVAINAPNVFQAVNDGGDYVQYTGAGNSRGMILKGNGECGGTPDLAASGGWIGGYLYTPCGSIESIEIEINLSGTRADAGGSCLTAYATVNGSQIASAEVLEQITWAEKCTPATGTGSGSGAANRCMNTIELRAQNEESWVEDPDNPPALIACMVESTASFTITLVEAGGP
jgi:hypothetical protein